MSPDGRPAGSTQNPRLRSRPAMSYNFNFAVIWRNFDLLLFGLGLGLLLAGLALLVGSAIGMAGRETAIGDAIGLAVKRLREQPQAQRVLVLLTDGVNTAGALDPLDAAELARSGDTDEALAGMGAVVGG